MPTLIVQHEDLHCYERDARRCAAVHRSRPRAGIKVDIPAMLSSTDTASMHASLLLTQQNMHSSMQVLLGGS